MPRWDEPWSWSPEGAVLKDRHELSVLVCDGPMEPDVRRLLARSPEVLSLLAEIVAEGLDAARKERAEELLAAIEEGATVTKTE